MPISTNNILLVANTVMLLVPADSMAQQICVQNVEKTSSHDMYIGNGSVTVSNGVWLAHTDKVFLTLGPGDSLYGITPVADLNCRILIIKQD